MTEKINKHIKYGLVGKISTDANNSSVGINQFMRCFELTQRSVVIIWKGKYLNAVGVQYPDDAFLDPGTYKINPCIGEYLEGLVYGQFFRDSFPSSSRIDIFPAAMKSYWGNRYRSEGLEALEKLNGAWVSVFYDNIKKRLVIARDPVGIENVYITNSDKNILFATDLRIFQLLRLFETNNDLDEQAISEFLHFLYVPSPRTIYKNVTAILPGHACIIESDVNQVAFSGPRFQYGPSISNRNKLESVLDSELLNFEEHLFNAVRDLLPSTGKIGLLFSGGKDSSALAIALKELAASRTIAITVGSSDYRLDESRYASQIAKYLGLNHFIYTPTYEELFKAANELFSTIGQPVGDPALLPLIAMKNRLPGDISVIIDGTGNDYYFGIVRSLGKQGYEWRNKYSRYIPKIIKPFLLNILRIAPSKFRHLGEVWKRPIEESFISWNGWSAQELSRLCGRKVDFSATNLWHTMRTNQTHGWIALQTQVICGIWEPHSAYAKVVLFAKESQASPRFPFADNRLSNYVSKLPRELKYEGSKNKILLRAFLNKYLPTELILRPKGSFVVDRTRLLNYGKSQWLRLLNEENSLFYKLGWSKYEVDNLIRNYVKNPKSYADRIYSLLVLAVWWRSNILN